MATQSIWCQIYIATFLLTPAFIAANNIAHTHVTYVFGPSQGSYFGYSILAHSSPKSGVSLWVGAPKYSAPSTSGVESTAKHGMIYRCPLSDNTECTSINVGEKMGPGNNSSDIHSQLPGLALEACDFQKGLCGFYQRDDSDFDWVRTNSSGLTSTRVKKRRTCKNFRSNKSFLRITGPASYTVNDFYLNADSINANPTKSGLNYAKTILVSPLIKSTSGIVQCLRFCFNAFSHVTKTRRILKVWMTYNESLTPDIRSAQIGKEFRLFTFDGTRDVASSHWNYAEEDITGKYDGYYRLYFEARVFHNDVAIDKCGALGDIVITDIIVANLACGDEKTDVDEVETEQSLGLSLAAKKSTGDSNVIQIATCAPLWQHNCGYAKEANGICYELEANQTHVQTVYSHNPISQECIRGKIDVVLLVDQSGSVNQCNYQKVKGWLRNIIRSFNFGPSEQDIGVVVYSSPTLTKPVVNLGFEAYDNNGLEKKQQMLKVLTTLPYEAGKTYTGLALKIANDMLTGPNARPDAKKMMILLTDGATTKENTAQLDEQVQRARDLNTTVLAVGVGKFNPKELINIAGSKKNFFAVKKFSELEKVRDNLRGSVSSGTLEGSSTNMTSQDLQQCQLGFSAYYSKDSLRMGSPGCYSLGGNVISHGEHDHVQEPTTGANQAAFTTFQPQTEPSSFTEGNKNIFSNITFDSTTQFPSKSTKEVVTSSHEESTSQFGDYEVPSLSDIRSSIFGNVSNSYFGYATTGGYYFGEKMGEFVASSAPRHQGNGSVLIFDSLSREGAAQRHFMIGLQYGEYFGATLCSEDFNSDGYTDLVVGAPLHSSRYSDEGRAYIYMGGQKMSASPDSILHGGKSRFGRFGKSISAVGDLNADGYPDLAVSAPLENNGVVYIYHGSRAGVITVDVQRLEPQLLKPQPLVPPMNFGETVEGKVDVDGNGYPDLIIGAPVTSSIIIMLTRPVVNVNLTIISSDEIDSRSKACMETGPSSAFNSCFNCSVCFLFHGRSLPTEILLQYNIYADVLQEKSRVSFTSTGQDHVTGSVKLFSQEKFYCHDYSLRMKPKVRDFMNPVALGLHYHLDDRFMPEPVRNVTTTTTTTPTLENSTLSSSGDYEYEGEEESKRKKRNVGDEKELFPILNMYNHKYYQTGVPFKTFCRNITQCIADVKLTTQTINKIGEAISSITVGRDRIIRIRVKVTNIGPEDAHDTRVTVIYSNKLYFNVLKKTDDTIDACFENDGTPEIYDDSRKIFSFKLRSYILMKGDFCVVDILFGITYLLDPYTDGSAEFNISTSTLSLDENTTNSNQKVKVDLTYTAPLTFTGVSWPNVATVQTNSSYFPLGLNELQNTSQLVEQVFLISNLGNMELRNMVLNVEWPANVFMDNQLYDGFYIKNITCTGRMAKCSCSSENLIDKYEIFSNISSQPSLKIPDSPIDLQSFIDCQGACVTNFQCTVDYIRGYGSVQLTVVALPYPNTFSTLQSSILVKSTGSLQIKEKGFLIFDFRKGGKTTNIETKVIPLKQFEFAGQESGFVFPLWAYILSAVIGLLLLLLLMFILKMCGFFKSKYGEKKKAAEEERQWGEAAVPLKQ